MVGLESKSFWHESLIVSFLSSSSSLSPSSVTSWAVLWQRFHKEQVCFWEQVCEGWWVGNNGGEESALWKQDKVFGAHFLSVGSLSFLKTARLTFFSVYAAHTEPDVVPQRGLLDSMICVKWVHREGGNVDSGQVQGNLHSDVSCTLDYWWF